LIFIVNFKEQKTLVNELSEYKSNKNEKEYIESRRSFEFRSSL
jgi:hypothetical protein